MRPILIEFGNIAIPSYGVFLVISFLAAIFLVKQFAKKFNISALIIENLAFYLMVGVIVGGRLLYVIFHWAKYENDLLGIIRLWEGGMMFFGGFLGAFFAGLLFLRKEKVSVLLIGDLIAPAIALGEFFTRIGCFLNGCCFGTPSTLPWAMTFPDECVAGSSVIGDLALHPTQLYSSGFGLLLFFFLWWRLYRLHKQGEIFGLYLLLSGTFRFVIDFIRFYEDSGNFLINQIIAAGIALLGAYIYIKAKKK